MSHFIIYASHLNITFEAYPCYPTDKTARCRATIVFHRVAAAPVNCLPSLDNVTSCLVIYSSKLKVETGGSSITYPPVIFWKTKLYFAIYIFLYNFFVFEALVNRYKAIDNEYTVFSCNDQGACSVQKVK